MSKIEWFQEGSDINEGLTSRHVSSEDVISITMTESGGHRVYYRVRGDEGFCGDSPYSSEEQELFDMAAADRAYKKFLEDSSTPAKRLDLTTFPEWMAERKRQMYDQHD